MIAMVGGMFFAAPQIASADNGDTDNTPTTVVVVRDRNQKATFLYAYLPNGRISVVVIFDDGRTFEGVIEPEKSV